MEKKLLATILKERKSFEALERLSVAESFSDPGKDTKTIYTLQKYIIIIAGNFFIYQSA